MKKFFENFSEFWTALFKNKPKFYLVLNCILCIFAITCFIVQMCIGGDYIIGAIGWVFVGGQWVCIFLQSKDARRINNDRF